MSTKAPIYLKRRSTRKGKKEKLRDILSSDMISPPLGDFRHTIHIGSGGGDEDLFGDLSFLQGKFHLLPGQHCHSLSQRSSVHSEPFQFSRTTSVSRHAPSSESSPLLKNALSLPIIGKVQAITLPVTSAPPSDAPPPQNAAPPPKPPRLHLDDKVEIPHQPPLDSSARSTQLPNRTAQFCQPSPRVTSNKDMCIQEPYLDEEGMERPYLTHAGSLLSLHLDLGPSILDDVLQIMDSQRLSGLNGTSLHSGRQELYT